MKENGGIKALWGKNLAKKQHYTHQLEWKYIRPSIVWYYTNATVFCFSTLWPKCFFLHLLSMPLEHYSASLCSNNKNFKENCAAFNKGWSIFFSTAIYDVHTHVHRGGLYIYTYIQNILSDTRQQALSRIKWNLVQNFFCKAALQTQMSLSQVLMLRIKQAGSWMQWVVEAKRKSEYPQLLNIGEGSH